MSEAHVPQGEASLTFGSDAYLDPIAELTNVEFGGSTGKIDFTNNDSPLGTAEFKPGQRDLGTISADFVCMAGQCEAMEAAWQARSVEAFDLTFWTSGYEKTGTAYISDFSVKAELKGESVVEGSLTLTVISES